MVMDIDKSRRYHQALCVDDASRSAPLQISDIGDLAGPDTDIRHPPWVPGAVDELASANENVVLLPVHKRGYEQQNEAKLHAAILIAVGGIQPIWNSSRGLTGCS